MNRPEDFFYRGGKKISLRRVSPSDAVEARGSGPAAVEAYVPADLPQGAAPDCLLVPTGEVVVRFTPDVDQARVEHELDRRGARVVRRLDYMPNGYLVRARSEPGQALRLANDLHEQPFVVAAEPNWIRRTLRR